MARRKHASGCFFLIETFSLCAELSCKLGSPKVKTHFNMSVVFAVGNYRHYVFIFCICLYIHKLVISSMSSIYHYLIISKFLSVCHMFILSYFYGIISSSFYYIYSISYYNNIITYLLMHISFSYIIYISLFYHYIPQSYKDSIQYHIIIVLCRIPILSSLHPLILPAYHANIILYIFKYHLVISFMYVIHHL